jgi:hypothetical protein
VIPGLLRLANVRYLSESSCLTATLIIKTNFPFDKVTWLPSGKLMMTSGGMHLADKIVQEKKIGAGCSPLLVNELLETNCTYNVFLFFHFVFIL